MVGRGGGAYRKESLFLLAFYLLFVSPTVFAAWLFADSNEAWMGKTVRITGYGFSPDTNFTIGNNLEPNTFWWDGYDDQWGFPAANVLTDSNGAFIYDWNIPYDFRISPGKQQLKVGNQIASTIYWTGGGNYTTSKNGIACNATNCFAVSSYTAPLGGVEKFDIATGNRDCNITVAANGNDIAIYDGNVYSVHDGTSNNLRRTSTSNCASTPFTTAAVANSYSIRISSDGNAFITYLASTAPRKYRNLGGTPVWDTNFAPTAVASIAYDICISPDNNRVFVGFADGNTRAYDYNSGSIYWNSDPDDVNVTLAVLGLDCDANAVYVAKGLNNTSLGPFYGGTVEALDRNTGALLWRSERINSMYVYGQHNNIKCDSTYCYAVVQAPTLGGAGIAGAPIIQIRKSDGKIGWIKWRSWHPASTAAYGTGPTHGSPQNLWVDQDVNGFIYAAYSNGRVQKLAKNDVNVQSFPDTNLWVRSNPNLYNFIMNPTKNVFYSNESPTFTFKAVDSNGADMNVDDNRLNTSYLRFSTINAFSEFTAAETVSSQFMDPRIMNAYSTSTTQPNPSPYNYLRFMYDAIDTVDGGAAPGHCPSTLYTNSLYGWHQLGRYCLYENLDLNHPTLGHTQNGVYLSATTLYALVVPKKWSNYPITKTFGTDNWAWLSDHNSMFNQVLGFATRFGKDQNEVWSNQLGRTTFFNNTAATTSYIYDHVDAALDFNNPNPALQQWHESYFLFKPKGSGIDGNRHWQYVEQDTNAIANPIQVSLGENVSGSFVIDGNTYSNKIEFSATEPGLFDRNSEVFWFDVNFTEGIRTDCSDLIVTDNSNNIIGLPASSSPSGLWQVDANTCSVNNNYVLFVQDNFAKSQTKQYRLYYNAPTVSIIAPGASDLVVYNISGSCVAGTDSIDVNSQNWFAWQNIGEGGATETVRFKFDANQQNWFGSTTHYTMNLGYQNAQTAGTGAGTTAEGLCASGSTCGTAVNTFASRCYQRSANNNKIFTKIDMNTANITVTPHLGTAQTRKIMSSWYFFNNNGRIRIKTKLNAPLPVMTTGISQNKRPYYFWGTYSLVPQGTYNDDWFNWSGRKEVMDAYVPATISADKKTAILRPSPLPLMFTIDYNQGHFENVSSATSQTGKGCTVHKVWPYFSWRPLGPLNATGATTFATAYTTEFISCHSDLNASIPAVGNDGYVNAFPKESIFGTGLNKFVDPNSLAKFYLRPNLFIPDNRENKWLPPLALNAQYGTSAKLSTYVLDVCPFEDYGYKGFDDFLNDLDNLTASTSSHLVTSNRNSIPCATSLIRFTTNVGSYGAYFLFQKDVNVVVADTARPDAPYPSNLYNATGGLSVNGFLDYTFTQKSTYFLGKWFFTSSSNPWVVHAYTTTGAEQLSGQTRYAWAPSFAYNKRAFDESGIWRKEDQNMTYYHSPCNWNIGSNPFGDMDLGPGWINNFSATSKGTICPGTLDNVEKYPSFRAANASLYPTSAIAAIWDEQVIDGRPNKPTAIGDLGINAALYARHNSLWDYNHYSDYTQVISDLVELNEGTKHPNNQPWMCDFSRAENKNFCMVPLNTTTLIFTTSPGTLTTTSGWSPYYQSNREYSNLRYYLYNRFFDALPMLPTYDFAIERWVYPMLSKTEVTYDMLYTSLNADDYNRLMRKVFPKLLKSLYQNQFLIRDWKNTAFMSLSNDSREFLRGQTINVDGFMMKNSDYLANAPIIVQVFKNSAPTVPLKTYQTTTDGNGNFTYSYTIPTTAYPGLYFFKASYNNDDVNGTTSFKVSSLAIAVTLNKTAYVAGDSVQFSAAVTDAITGLAISDASLTLQLTGPSGNVLLNNVEMTNAGSGTYTYGFVLDSNTAKGTYVAVINATSASNTGTATTAFGVSAEVGEVQITNNFQLADANRNFITQTATLQNLIASAVNDYVLNFRLSPAIDRNQIASVIVDSTSLSQTTNYGSLNENNYYLSFDSSNNPIIYLKQDFVPNETKTAVILAKNYYFTLIERDYNSANNYNSEVAGYCAVLLSPAAQTDCINANQYIMDINNYYRQTQTATKADVFYSLYLQTHEKYSLFLTTLSSLRSLATNQSSCRIFVPNSWAFDSNVTITALMLGPSSTPLSGLSVNVTLHDYNFNLLQTYSLNEFGSGWYFRFFTAPSTGGGYHLKIDQNIGVNRFQCAASFDVNQSTATATGGSSSGGLTADQNNTLYQIFFLVTDINSVVNNIKTIVTDINNSVNTINANVSSIQSTVNTTNTRLSGIDSNVTYIKTNMATAASLQDLNTYIQSILNYSTDINSKVYTINSDLGTMLSGIQDVNSKVNWIDSNVTYIKTNMATAASLQDLNTYIQSILTYSIDINGKVTDSNNLLHGLDANLLALGNTIDSIKSTALDINNTLNTCAYAPISSVCGRLGELLTSLSDINNTLENVRTTTNDINNTTNSVQTTMNTINSTTNNILTTVNDINNTSHLIKTKVNAVDENISLLLADTDAIQNLLNCSSTPTNSVCQRLSDINSVLNDFNSQTNSTLSQIVTYVDSLESGQTAIDENLSIILNELNCTTPSGDDICNGLLLIQEYTDSLETGISDLNKTILDIKTNVLDINSTASTTLARIIDLNQANQTILSDTATIKSNITTTQSMISDLNTHIIDLNSKITLTNTNLQDLNNSLQQVLSYSIDINRTVVDSNRSINQLNSTTSDINSAVNSVRSTVLDINNTINTCSYAPTTSICGKLNTLSTSITDLNTTLNRISSAVSDVNNTTNSVQTTVNTINSTANNIWATVNDINNTSHLIKTKVNAVDENISLLLADTDAIQNLLNCSSTPTNSVCQRLSDINSTLRDFNSQTAQSLLQIINYVDTLESRSAAIDGNLSLVLAELNCTSPDANDVCTGLMTIKGYTDSLESGILDLNRAIGSIKTYVLDINTTASETLQGISDLNGSTQALRSDTTSIKSNITSTQSMISDVNSRILDINAVVQDINKTTTDTNTITQDIQTTVQEIRTTTSGIGAATRDINAKVRDINTAVHDLNTGQTSLASAVATLQSVLADVNDTLYNVRSSQTQKFTVVLGDFGKIEPGKIYYAKLWVFDFNGSPKNADSLPKISLYDPSRNLIVSSVDMNLSETGIYTYSFTSTSGQTAGQWETIASATVNGSTVKPSDWWELTGNPPEVKINGIIDTTIPTISANVTITNEGASSQEYQYEYCIVSSQTNQCGGSDDIDYASGAKLITPGQSWNTNLSLSASSAGTYWFKVKVYYGAETSAASKQFSTTLAAPETGTGTGQKGGGGGGGGGGSPATALAVLPEATTQKGALSIIEFPHEMVVGRGSFEFFLVKAKNTGNTSITDLKLSFENLLLDWYSVDYCKTDVAPNEESLFVVKIMIPANAEAKDYLTSLKISGGGVSDESQTVLRVVQKQEGEIRVIDVKISRMSPESIGEIEVELLNTTLKDINVNVSILAPVDWEIKRNYLDLILKAGMRKEIAFTVKTTYRSGVAELLLVVKSNEKEFLFTDTGEDKIFKQLLVIVQPPQKAQIPAGRETGKAAVQAEPFPATLVSVVVLVAVSLFFVASKFRQREGLISAIDMKTRPFKKKEPQDPLESLKEFIGKNRKKRGK